MASCINPRYRKYFDPFSGEERSCVIPCGKCANCLANEQDSWAIRISETAYHHKDFIYDTFTFRPQAFEGLLLDVSDALADSDFVVSAESAPLLEYWFSRYGYGNLPLFEKSLFSAFIKRGRERYYQSTGERLHFKYLVCMEYGPKYSRPHAHGLFFGLDYGTYLEYFAKPWRKDYGFTKTKFVVSGSRGGKDVSCISRYVSKYVNKGFFESPLVKNGLLPKCWRMVSNGIGEEYLSSERFAPYRSLRFRAYRGTYTRAQKRVRRVFTDPTGKILSEFDAIVPTPRSRGLFRSGKYVGSFPLLTFSQDQLQKLITYVDSSGYYHALPRYYRDRLLGRDPSFAKYSVQVALLAYAKQRHIEKVLRYASSLKYTGARQRIAEAYAPHICTGTFALADFFLSLAEKNKREMEEKRHFTMMKNHYFRTKNSKSSYVQLNQ